MSYSGDVIAMATRTLVNQLRNPSINCRRRIHIVTAMVRKLAELEGRSMTAVKREFPMSYEQGAEPLPITWGINKRRLREAGQKRAQQNKRPRAVWDDFHDA